MELRDFVRVVVRRGEGKTGVGVASVPEPGIDFTGVRRLVELRGGDLPGERRLCRPLRDLLYRSQRLRGRGE